MHNYNIDITIINTKDKTYFDSFVKSSGSGCALIDNTCSKERKSIRRINNDCKTCVFYKRAKKLFSYIQRRNNAYL